MDLFRDILPSILQTKKDLTKEEGFDKSYTGFVVNRAISFHYDCIMQANEMNRYPGLSPDMQYQFLLNTIRGYKRPYRQWQKRETIQDLEAVKEYYGYSNEKARDVMGLLNTDQLEEIKKRIDKGGTYDSKPKRVRGGKAS